MTRFISFRTNQGWGRAPASVWEVSLGPPIGYSPVILAKAGADAAGKDVIFAVHGFNISREGGVKMLTELEARLALPDTAHFIGILWPGDFMVPVVNYSFEAGDAVWCGQKLAELFNQAFPQAASVSLVSHSLGGRLLLETLAGLDAPARQACITAGALDYDCLERQYLPAMAKVERLSVLASAKDNTLRYAYPAGDFLSDLFGDNDSPFARALGLKGPHKALASPGFHRQIPDKDGFDHSDYVSANPRDPPNAKSRKAARFIERTLKGGPNQWP